MLISRLFTIGIMTAAIMACSNESTDANSAVIPEQSSNSVTSNAPVLKSPAGVWLISSKLLETNTSPEFGITSSIESKQLVVLEEIGDGIFRFHECGMNIDVDYATTKLVQRGERLFDQGAYQDKRGEVQYSESYKIELEVLNDQYLNGVLLVTDQDSNGGYNGIQHAMISGNKFSDVGSLSELTDEDIAHVFAGEKINKQSTNEAHSITCLASSKIESNGTNNWDSVPQMVRNGINDVRDELDAMPVDVNANSAEEVAEGESGSDETNQVSSW